MTNDLLKCIQVSSDATIPDTDRRLAFGKLVMYFQDMAFGYALSLLGNRHLAEDATQEGFVAAWQNIDSLREPDSFPAWLRRIVQWQCYRFQRRRSRLLEPLRDEIQSVEESPLDRVSREETGEKVRAAIEALPDTLREVTLLRYIGDNTRLKSPDSWG